MCTKIDDIIKSDTPILEFYRNKRLFLTGATGFFGKVIMEKLLRVTDIEHIYILIRNKKGKDVHTRLEEIFDNPVFEIVKRTRPNYQQKISVIKGDCSLPHLGISSEEFSVLQENVDIIIHAAATVRFDEKLKIALTINVCGTKDIITMAQEFSNLKAMVHVSTTFAHCNHSHIDEKFYKVKMSGENACRLADLLDERALDNITHELIRDYPNTYTYTKAIAEDVIRCSGKGLPIAIFRPAMVIGTYKEPIPGWIDNIYGPGGIIVGVASGTVRTFHVKNENFAHLVPVDLAINALLTAAYDISKNTYDEPPIYNFIPDPNHTITWGNFLEVGRSMISTCCIKGAIWYPCMTGTSSKFMFNLLAFLYHTVPGFLMDVGLIAIGRKPRMMKIYRKVNKFIVAVGYFGSRSWTFANNNTQRLYEKMTKDDQVLFDFNMRTVDWVTMLEDAIYGMRNYILKHDPSDDELAKTWHSRMKCLHYTVVYGIYLLALCLAYVVLSKLLL